ncbi:hypothetical protein [Aquimarina agarivorans]|uniref:hypothetical protein n=1 Tax=Aquimarina agarivorans TaxID=980584 RepID=UPI000248EB01|nr:hypothetical protein [Aquimarina agarivorans]
MYNVLYYSCTLITEEKYNAPSIKEIFNISKKAELFNQELAKLDDLIAQKELTFNESKPLIQGPFSDILTHTGQIAMLSRLHGAPIDGEDFSKALITPGIV